MNEDDLEDLVDTGVLNGAISKPATYEKLKEILISC